MEKKVIATLGTKSICEIFMTTKYYHTISYDLFLKFWLRHFGKIQSKLYTELLQTQQKQFLGRFFGEGMAYL